tara:strand:- start:444 stop:560 length:117 start_codon:yes stop_codon:yes gene_type:complete
MAKSECKDGKCEVDIPNLTIENEEDTKEDKKDSSKRLT